MGVFYETIWDLHAPWPAVIAIVAMAASFWPLAVVMWTIPVGMASIISTAIGAVGAFLVPIIPLGEAVNAPRIIAAILVVGGLALEQLSSG